MAKRDSKDHIRVLLHSSYTSITAGGDPLCTDLVREVFEAATVTRSGRNRLVERLNVALQTPILGAVIRV